MGLLAHGVSSGEMVIVFQVGSGADIEDERLPQAETLPRGGRCGVQPLLSLKLSLALLFGSVLMPAFVLPPIRAESLTCPGHGFSPFLSLSFLRVNHAVRCGRLVFPLQ